MIDPHKLKYHELYWRVAEAAAQQSRATRAKVGAVVVTPTGMLSIGFNGMPAGFDNGCESIEVTYNVNVPAVLKTKPEVIHAERNALDKMHRQGIPTHGSIVFITLSPCFECAKSLLGLGLKAIYYDQIYKDASGIDLLKKAGITVIQKKNIPAHVLHNCSR